MVGCSSTANPQFVGVNCSHSELSATPILYRMTAQMYGRECCRVSIETAGLSKIYLKDSSVGAGLNPPERPSATSGTTAGLLRKVDTNRELVSGSR